MITTEKEWNKLTKKELVHLLRWCLSDSLVEEGLKRSRDLQKKKHIRCYECESIERKVKL